MSAGELLNIRGHQILFGTDKLYPATHSQKRKSISLPVAFSILVSHSYPAFSALKPHLFYYFIAQIFHSARDQIQDFIHA